MTAKGTAVYLTEGDCFMFALEKKHLHKTNISDNTCRYLFTVQGSIDAVAFKKKINLNQDITWLASLIPEKRSALSVPKWRVPSHQVEVPVWSYYSENFLPEEIIARKIHIDQPPLLTFDIIYRENGDSTILFSWHHLVMDGHGAILLLKQIADDLTATTSKLYDFRKPGLLGFRSFWQAARAKFFVDRVSRKPLGGIMDLRRSVVGTQKISVLRLTAKETANIDHIAPKLGAQFGRSPFYLACAARAVSAVLKRNGIPVHDFWVPVPRNQRLKGAKGPILGNHIAFLFYRIKTTDLRSFSSCVQTINEQTKQQIRSGMTRAYDLLIRFLRRTPLPLYYFWIKGPKGGSLASFLFTVAADHPDELSTFAGYPVTDALSLPSNIYPPGLTFAFMHFQGSLHLMTLYFEGILTASEANDMEKQLRHELTTGTPFTDALS